MPGDARQRRRVGRANLGERLGRRDDLDYALVVEPKPVPGSQSHGLGQIEQKLEATHARHRDAATVSLVEIEHDRVGGLPRPVASG